MMAQGCMRGPFAAASCTDISASRYITGCGLRANIGHDNDFNGDYWVSIHANYLAAQWLPMNTL